MANTIPVSEVVNVEITTSATVQPLPGFGIMLAVIKDGTAVGIQKYNSIEEVAVDFPSGEENVMATTYFSQQPRPEEFWIGSWDFTGAETVTEALDRLQAADSDWYSFAFDKAVRDDSDVESAASWTEARTKQFYTVSNDVASYDENSTTDTLAILNIAQYRRTFLMYSSFVDEYPEVSAFARAATVDFDFENSTITLKFKQEPGISTESLTTTQLSALEAKGGNAYITVGGNPMISNSIMVKGIGTYQDTVHGVDWLTSEIENGVFNLLYQTPTKIPVTDEGASRIVQRVNKALSKGVSNGLIAPSGETVDGVYLAVGYQVTVGKVADMSLTDRQQRKAPPIAFVAIGAGAIHTVEIKGVFEV